MLHDKQSLIYFFLLKNVLYYFLSSLVRKFLNDKKQLILAWASSTNYQYVHQKLIFHPSYIFINIYKN